MRLHETLAGKHINWDKYGYIVCGNVIGSSNEPRLIIRDCTNPVSVVYGEHVYVPCNNAMWSLSDLYAAAKAECVAMPQIIICLNEIFKVPLYLLFTRGMSIEDFDKLFTVTQLMT